MELLDQTSTEERVQRGLQGPGRTAAIGLAVVCAALLAVALMRPSGGTLPSIDDDAAAEQSPGGATDDLGDADARGSQGRPSSAGRQGTMDQLRAERVEFPEAVDVEGFSDQPLVMIGQSPSGQIAAIDLLSGEVTEIDEVSGQLFKPRVASATHVTGFRVFLQETLIIDATGHIMSMPVTEMDLPVVVARRDGFVIHEMFNDAVWAVDADGVATELRQFLPDLELRAATSRDLIVMTLDGVERHYDPETGLVGAPLIGRVVAHGATRYASQNCETGTCRIEVREYDDNALVAEVDVVLDRLTTLTLSPSDRYLAVYEKAALRVIDLDQPAASPTALPMERPFSVWAPDDSLLYWPGPPIGVETEQVFAWKLMRWNPGTSPAQTSGIIVPGELLDPGQPIFVVENR